MLLTALRVWLWVCLEKNTPDLFLLMAYLDQLQYFPKTQTRFEASLLVALVNRITSSVYMTWVMVGLEMLILMPLMFFDLSL